MTDDKSAIDAQQATGMKYRGHDDRLLTSTLSKS